MKKRIQHRIRGILKRKSLLIGVVGVLIIAAAVFAFVKSGDLAKPDSFSSVENGIVAFSPNGARGGAIIPASCESPYFYAHTPGECSPINGACSPTHYNCAAGILGARAEYPDAAHPTLYQWQWWCNGTNGGADKLCFENKPPPPLTVSCSVSPSSIGAGGTVTWAATPGGGSGSYSYSWSDTAGGSGSTGAVNSWSRTYSSAGAVGASVSVASTDGQTASGNCGNVTVTAIQPGAPQSPSIKEQSCPAPGTQGILRWTALANATYYMYGADATGDKWNGDCGTVGSYPGDSCNSNFPYADVAITTLPGKAYTWWVLACNASGCSAPTGGSFVCGGAPALACSPASQNTTVRRQVSLTALNGNGSYSWSGPPDARLTAEGANAAVSFNNPGNKAISVSSGGQTAQCAVNVTGGGGNPTLSVSLVGNPASGQPPLNGVNLTATVGGTAQGSINYTFYCNRSDSGTNVTSGWNAKFDGVTANPKTAVCNYPTAGGYTAKVIAERNGAPAAEARQAITVGSGGVGQAPSCTLTYSPSSIPAGATTTATFCEGGYITTTWYNSCPQSLKPIPDSQMNPFEGCGTFVVTPAASGSCTVGVANPQPTDNAGYCTGSVTVQGGGGGGQTPSVLYIKRVGSDLTPNTAPTGTITSFHIPHSISGQERVAGYFPYLGVMQPFDGFTPMTLTSASTLNPMSAALQTTGQIDSVSTSYVPGYSVSAGECKYPLAGAECAVQNFQDVACDSTWCTYNAGARAPGNPFLQPGQQTKVVFKYSTSPPVKPNVPAISILANGVSGTIMLSAPANYIVTWNVTNADSCTASGSWSGAKALSGSQIFSGVGRGLYSYGLFCTNANGSAYGSVGVNVSTIHEIPP